jgi:hypothetical protein
MPFGQGVRGINDAKFALLAGDVPGSSTDYAGVKALSVEVTSDSDNQTGDDAVLMTVQENKALEITISAAYSNPAALGVATGYAPVTSGVSPASIITWKDPASPNTSYIQISAQAKGRDATGSAMRITILKAQLTGGPNWDFSEGDWMEPELTFTGVGRGTPSYLYELAAYETEVPMT